MRLGRGKERLTEEVEVEVEKERWGRERGG
jgi:hypothetical protein